MLRVILGFGLVMGLAPAAFAASPAKPNAETSLLQLCDSFGETTKECRCYMDAVKTVYKPADIDLAGMAARGFMNGERPEAIAAYLLMTRKITVTRARKLYTLGDKHVDRVGRKCEDRNQKITPQMKAKRDAMTKRLEVLGKRYRIGVKG